MLKTSKIQNSTKCPEQASLAPKLCMKPRIHVAARATSMRRWRPVGTIAIRAAHLMSASNSSRCSAASPDRSRDRYCLAKIRWVRASCSRWTAQVKSMLTSPRPAFQMPSHWKRGPTPRLQLPEASSWLACFHLVACVPYHRKTNARRRYMLAESIELNMTSAPALRSLAVISAALRPSFPTGWASRGAAVPGALAWSSV
mmetsp:Transcript_31161/g.70859  ORF Transcript_31161/g.70859 Transcript_31161/m.70859 type:complete len:200 (-) Transcript_31161:84-683(-)